ncbi:MAG TPA: fused MFS/spermidine synthase [Myxococcota bacterium]|nr:fused MFS/spermidine synthase [Myxococcota bacterium]
MTRPLALLLTTVTGASGLVYEVTWQRYLATLLGSHSEATAAVLAIFLFGLSLGYSLFGILTRVVVRRAEAAGRTPRLLALYGAVEAGIGVFALAFPWLFVGIQELSFALPHTSPGIAFGIDVLLAALLVLPPTILMGATIPLLTQALARSLEDAARFHALVYAFNTAGAFVGALAAGWYLIPAYGLGAVMIGVSVTNLAAGAIFGVLGLRSRSFLRIGTGDASAPPVEGLALLLAVALLGGFAMMALQTVVIRMGGLALGASGFTFSAVVAVFVFCIAIGSMGVSLFSRIRPGYLLASQWALVALLFLLHGPIGDAPYGMHVLRTFFRDQEAAFYPYYASAFLVTLAVIGPAVVLSGAMLPLLFSVLRGEAGELGALAGRIYSWNTLGSLFGALLGGYLLLFWVDLDQVYRIAVGAVVVSAALLTFKLTRVPLLGTLGIAAPILGLLVLLPGWSPEMLSSGLFRQRNPAPATYLGADAVLRATQEGQRILLYDDDPTTSVAVKEIALDGGRRQLAIVTNGKPDSSTEGDYPTMALAGLLAAAFADTPERAFVIGFGTGVTAGVLAGLDSIREVEVAEISSGVIRGAPLFDFANGRVSKSPKVRLMRSDAYRALRRSEGQFDVIASEPSNPWVSGIEMLYSREFLEAARGRLRPGGVYCQWYHQYESNDRVVELVLRTVNSVFPHTAIWYGTGSDLLILGFNRDGDDAGALDLERLERRFVQPDFAAAFRRAKLRTMPELLAHELVPLDVVAALGLKGPVHTLFHPRLSHEAGMAFYGGGAGMLPYSGAGKAAEIGQRNSMLARYQAKAGGDLSDADRALAAQEMCKNRAFECIAMLGDWQRRRPDSPLLAATLKEAVARGPTFFGGNVDASLVPVVARLLESKSDGKLRPDQLAQVRRIYYHPAIPYPNGVAALPEASRQQTAN